MWLQNCYDALKTAVEEFIRQSKFIAIGIAIGICVIEVCVYIVACATCITVNIGSTRNVTYVRANFSCVCVFAMR